MKRKSLKTALNLCVLFAGTLIAHLLAGGIVVMPLHLLGNTVFLGLLLLLLSKALLEGPKLALLVVISQSAGHLLLGGTISSNLTMSLSHIVGGTISYILISRCESIWDSSLGALTRLFLPIQLRILSIHTNIEKLFTRGRLLRFVSHINSQFLLRGPPIMEARNFS